MDDLQFNIGMECEWVEVAVFSKNSEQK